MCEGTQQTLLTMTNGKILPFTAHCTAQPFQVTVVRPTFEAYRERSTGCPQNLTTGTFFRLQIRYNILLHDDVCKRQTNVHMTI